MIRIGNSALTALALGAVFAIGCGDGTAGPAGPRGTDGSPGTPGAPGDPGMPGSNDPSINVINPGAVYLSRSASVTIGGNGTSWTDKTTVDFGPGINAEIAAVNAGLLLVNLTIDETAATGARDVVVDSGADGGKVTLTGVFKVEAPLAIKGYQGTLAQGSIFVAHAEQRDLSTPFDATSDGENVTMTSAAGVEPVVNEVQEYTIDFNALVDVDTAPGDFDLHVASGLPNEVVSSPAPKALAIAARAPTALAEGQQSPGMVAAPYESYLYSFAPGAHKLVTIDASAGDSSATPSFALLPESGKFADVVSFGSSGRVLTVTDKPIYVIYWDNTGASGYSFDIDIKTVDSDDLEPNDACAMAQPLGGAASSLANLSLRGEGDEDWFVLDAAMVDVGRVVHVATRPGDDATDTLVEVFKGTCASLTPLGSPSGDTGYHEDHASAPISAPGPIYIKVSNSPTSSSGGSFYDLDVELLKTEIEPNDACAQANTVSSLPSDLKFVSLGSETDEDWFAVTVTAADVGKLLDVTTSAGDENTDTRIEVYSGGCGSPTLLGTSDDKSFLDTIQVGPLPSAGVYLVRIAASPGYPYAGSRYNVSFSAAVPPDMEPNDTCAEAQAGGAFGSALGPLNLPDQSDVDWFVFPASAADVGKSVRVVTAPGESNTDTVVEAFDGTCAALNTLGGASTDLFYHEDWQSAPITQAGLVYVKVSYSQTAYYASAYTLNVWYQ
jgi:hypothetical protein